MIRDAASLQMRQRTAKYSDDLNVLNFQLKVQHSKKISHTQGVKLIVVAAS